MKVEVITPEESMGDVIGDINSRRGLISELAERGNMKVVRAKVRRSGISPRHPSAHPPTLSHRSPASV